MQGWLLAGVSPVNTPHGYNLTFAYPMLLFIVIAGALYLRFRSPHKVPGHVSVAASHPAGATGAVRVEAGTAAAATAVAATAGADAGTAGDAAASQAEPAGTDGRDESEAERTETGE